MKYLKFLFGTTPFSGNKTILKYGKNTSWLLVDKVLRILATITVGAWLARHLGPQYYGELMYSNSVVALFLPISMIGLNDIVVKSLVKKEDRVSSILGTSFFLKLSCGVLSLLGLALYVFLVVDELSTMYLILFLAPYLLFQSIDVIDFFFQSEVKLRYSVYSRIIALVISNALKIILIILDAKLYFFAIAITIEILISIIFYIVFFFQIKNSIFSWRFNKKLSCSFLKTGWPLMLSGLMYIVYLKVDQIMVKEILGNSSSGIYAVAIGLSEAWYFVPLTLATSLFPAILSAKSKSEELYKRRLTKLYFFSFWISVLIAIFTTIFGEYLIRKLYGHGYAASETVLQIYIWSNVFFFFATISSKWLVAESLYLHAFYRNMIGAMSNIVLNIFFIHAYGLVGAALSTLISYSIVGLFYDLINKKLRTNFTIKLKSILCIN